MADERLGIILEAVDNASKTLKAVTAELQKLDTAAAKPGKTMTDLGNSLSSVGNSFQSAAGDTAAFSAALGVLGVSAVKTAGQFEQYRVAFDTFLGNAENARALLGDLSDFAAQTPFTLPEVVTGAKQLLAYGFAQDEVIEKLTSLGDLASGLQLPLSDLAFVFGTLKTQGRVFARDIFQFTLRGIPIVEALSKELGVTKAEVSELVSAGEIGYFEVEQALKSLTDEQGKLGGLMEKQSQTFLGTLSNIYDNLIRVGNALVGITPEGDIIEGSLLDTLSGYAKEAKVFLDELLVTVTEMDPRLKNLIIGFVAFGAALAPVLFIIGSLAGILGSVVTGLTAFATAGGLLGVFAGAGTAVAAFGAALTVLLPQLLVAAVAIGTLVAAWQVAKDVFADPGLELVNEQLAATIDAEENAAEERLSIKQSEYDEALSDYLKYTSQDDSTRADAAKTKLEAAATALGEERLQSLDSYVDFIEDARTYAASIGGVYDVKNNKILSGEKVFGLKLLGYTGAFGKSLVATIGSIATTMWIKFKGGLDKMLTGAKAVFDGIVSAASAAAGGDFEAAKSSIAGIFVGDNSVGAAASASEAKVASQVEAEIKSYLKNIQVIGETANAGLEERTSFDVNSARQKILDETAQLVTDAESAAGRVRDSLGDDVGGGSGSAADGVSKLKDRVEELGGELADLGIFAIKDGKKIVDTFKTAEEGVKKLKDRMTDLNNDQVDFTDSVEETRTSINDLLEDTITNTLETATSFDDLGDYIKEVQDSVKDLAKEHEKFITDAQKGIDDYADKVTEINDKFAEAIDTATTSAAESIGNEFVDNVNRQAEIVKELEDARSELQQAQADEEESRIETLNETITKLEDEADAIDGVQESINRLRTDSTGIGEELATVNTELAGLTGLTDTTSVERRNTLERERLLLLGEQQIATEKLAELEKAIADGTFTTGLDEAQKAAFELGQTLDEETKKRDEQLLALQELKTVQEAIVAGKLAELDVSKLTTVDAQELVAQATAEQEAYRANLEAQLVLLQEAQAKEVEIYATKYAAITEQQAYLEQFMVGSYDVIIAKLEAVATAAKLALAAQNAVTGGTSSSVPGFATGGFTGMGGLGDVAGVVHKGEWVAPNWLIKKLPSIFGQLEGIRSGKMKGFKDGGPTSSQTQFNQPITINAKVGGSSDWGTLGKRLAWELRSGR